MTRALLLFLDGVGIGAPDPNRNPFLRAELLRLRRALGGIPTLDEPRVDGPGGRAFPLDATLGVEGTPQSGTGQTALLTGRNAPRIYSRHFGPWTPVKLRPLLAEENLLSRSVARGLDTAFANAYPEGWPGERSTRLQAAPPLAARAAGLLTRHHQALARGDAVSSEIVNGGWRRHLGFTDLPRIEPEEAGANLARIAGRHRLTLYAHYSTDHAGHRGGMAGAVRALERVDRFLEGLLSSLSPDVLVIGASDHGNIEDVSVGHTRNPALGLVLGGDGSGALPDLEMDSITDVAPGVLGLLNGAG